MMIQYFRTHMRPEEDIWGLMISRARSALLITLGLSDENEDQLEPIYKMLKLSTMHQHFFGFQQSWSVDTPDKPEDGKDTAVKCPVCEELFGVIGSVRRFSCSYDEDADDTGLGPELQWGSWLTYWQHQVQKGHVVCPRWGSSRMFSASSSKQDRSRSLLSTVVI
ncbi:hypothetical protein BO82DRAFT_200504 [Aspergillus uvarum CBS 121591]|uniref:Uncharacterized protein n=1 Tax=Aspergillus uvarum CBS 121591 TaxID=1448315 RepID=A0A319CMD3_9EURO|nr:hypothetical protein BO82DRAFT_200504 [Aspergillus uvarum CBS 121591]PYH85191.1 hypothetical protein BO82DRAFT_200504 [Aspergillus uvarum CBS 121591]